MKLKFLGIGNAFSPHLGNNNAYFLTDKTLNLIDIGYTSFVKIIENKNNVEYEKVNIILTHMHSDHVGGLSDLLLYLKYNKNIKANIYVHENLTNDVVTLLEIQGVPEDSSTIISMKEQIPLFIEDFYLYLMESKHSEDLFSTSVYFVKDKKGTFYSSDISKLSGAMLHYLADDRTNSVYFDCASMENPVHTSIEYFENEPRLSYLSNVEHKYFMHLDSDYLTMKPRVENLGFEYVETSDFE